MTLLRQRIIIGLCASLFLAGHSAASDTSASDWPYPQDTPGSSALNIGLAGEQPVDISRYLLSRGVSQAAINPQGTQLAFISTATGERQLWVQSVQGGQATQLTFGNGISFFRWHPDGSQLIYGADNDGNEREAFYSIRTNGLSESLLLSHSNAFRRFGEFNHDGTRFTYASTERNGRDFDIYEHNINTGKSTMVYQAEFGFFPHAWQPNSSNVVVTETRGEDAQDVFLLDIHTGTLTPLYTPAVAAAFSNFHWSSDGKTLYFLSNLDREMTALYEYNTETETTRLRHQSEFDLDNLLVCHNQSSLVWTENNQGFDTLYTSRLNGSGLRKIALPDGVYQVSCANSSDVVAVEISSPTSPANVFVTNLTGERARLLVSATMAGIDSEQLITPQAIEFPARDGITLHGLLYLPKGMLNKVPLVVDVHGGPTAQAKPSWQPLTQYLVGKGIAVLDINVRGSTGFGKTYARLDNQEKRLHSVRDLVDALAYLKGDPRIDVENSAVMGGSYGGYMVNAVMGLYPDAFKAGASFVGVSDWVRALEEASPGLKASDRIEYGDIREPKWQAFYAENSPINTVHRIQAPMFFEHGVNDPRDPVTESDRMVKVLRDKGLPVTYLRFPDEGHSVSKLENRVTFYRALAEFLERHLTAQQ
ncbi:S9 family peptidase [Alteromonas sp. AMM-1]|uniref:S9 family peptidase n=1 Tax=Alteromonas sp. AMM-1 TaxID=3394233 RepID=UPI0039A603D0